MSNADRLSWALIGPGNIGKEIIDQVGRDYVAERLGLEPTPSIIVTSKGVFDNLNLDQDSRISEAFDDLSAEDIPDTVFIAIPSTDDGEVATSLISRSLSLGKLVVTAEKGALANNFAYLKKESGGFSRLGINATVGGGTRILDVMDVYCRDPDNITQIHMVLNGTMAAIMGYIGPKEGDGQSLGQAVLQATDLGYAEPGPQKPEDVIRAEAESDIPKKVSIILNRLGFARGVLNWKDLSFNLSASEIKQALLNAQSRRFIVSMYSPMLGGVHDDVGENVIGGFNVTHSGWRLVGGFQDINSNPLFSRLGRIQGPGNGAVIGLGPDESDGVYAITGPGAGVRPTVNTMLDDFITIRNNRRKR